MPRRQFADRVIAEALPQPVWSATLAGAVDYVNPFWSAFTGLSFEDSLGDGWTAALHPDDAGSALEEWNRRRAAEQSYEVEYRLRRAADGAWHRFRVEARPVRGAGGRILRWYGCATDLDEERSAAGGSERGRRPGTAGMPLPLPPPSARNGQGPKGSKEVRW